MTPRWAPGASVQLTAAELWDLFAKAVLPAGVSRIQRGEMQKAFYGGLLSGLDALQLAVGGGEIDEDLGVAYLEKLSAELNAFFDEVKAGKRGRYIAPGAWADGAGGLHLNMSEMLEAAGVADTPANRERLADAARLVAAKQGITVAKGGR